MSDRPVRDFSRSTAVLVGTARYRHLRPVEAAEHSLDRMRRLLTGELCGWPEDRVTVLADVPGEVNLPDLLVELFSGAGDTALFYFVGHGQADEADELCLALPGTREDADRRATTSLPYKAVRHALRASRATTTIVLLDCCHAGLAVSPDGRLAAGGDLIGLARTPGGALIGAAGPYRSARFEERSADGRPHTVFTRCLAEIVEEGVPGGPEVLTVGLLFRLLRDRLEREGKPVPTGVLSGAAGEFVFARNAAARVAPVTPVEQAAPVVPVAAPVRKRARRFAPAVALTIAAALTGYLLAPEVLGGGGTAVAGTLTGSRASLSSAEVDLSAEGALDWVQWGYQPSDATAPERFPQNPAARCTYNPYCVVRRAGTLLIGNFATLGTDPAVRIHDGEQPVSFAWHGGTPYASARDARSVVYQGGPGAGFLILVPGGTSVRTLRLYAGHHQAALHCAASFRDGGGPVYTDDADIEPNRLNANYYLVYTITFRPTDPSRPLEVRLTMTREYGGGNVALLAATLS
ncbi:caspase domain-containing protein [Kitasatospora sp. NPDC008115]|uniref:caspase family protein n=1 Tax=Kitasatospora sp. NPDC008115 TaxID=3364022 RepID=UPI0036F0F72A